MNTRKSLRIKYHLNDNDTPMISSMPVADEVEAIKKLRELLLTSNIQVGSKAELRDHSGSFVYEVWKLYEKKHSKTWDKLK